MRITKLVIAMVLLAGAVALAQGEALLLDDFETPVSGGPQGTVDFGSGGDSSVEVAASADIKNSGSQSIKITYTAAAGGYMWVARGFGLDSANAGWLVKPEDIKWDRYSAMSFYMYGSGSGAMVAFDVKDSGNEMWRFMLKDDFSGWKKITCSFSEFFARGDWQPDNADKNAAFDFPLRSFQFEPRPEAKGVVYFDTVELSG